MFYNQVDNWDVQDFYFLLGAHAEHFMSNMLKQFYKRWETIVVHRIQSEAISTRRQVKNEEQYKLSRFDVIASQFLTIKIFCVITFAWQRVWCMSQYDWLKYTKQKNVLKFDVHISKNCSLFL